MAFAIQEGARIRTSEGDDLGTVRQFVIRPSTAEVTHVLVEKGVFFTDDRVIPVEAIAEVEDDQVVLSDEVDPTQLPRFVRDHYTPLDDDTLERLDVPTGSHFVWRHPTALVGPFPMYPAYPIPAVDSGTRRVDDHDTRNQLEDSEVIGLRADVLSTKGEEVGKVSEVHVDDGGRLSHLVVDLGLLNGEKVLPAHWIDSVDGDGVHLAVGDRALETLETIT